MEKNTDFFDIQQWEAIQDKLAATMGITIKVISEDGLVNSKESNFNQFCGLIRKTDKGFHKCAELTAGKGDTKLINCPGAGLVHYCVAKSFYEKKFYLLVGLKEDTDFNTARINEIAKKYEIDTHTFETAYKTP